MGFYDRYNRYGYESPYERSARQERNRQREKEEKRQAKLELIPKVQVVVHITTKSRKGLDLKGMAAYVVDVSENGGEVAFRLPPGIHSQSLMGIKPPGEHELWDYYFFDYYKKLFERHRTTWLRALCNPNLAFVDTKSTRGTGSVNWTPRAIARRYFIQVLKEAGYQLAEGISK